MISPEVLELTLITAKLSPTAKLAQWDFVNAAGKATLPGAEAFKVTVNGELSQVKKVGFKRRVVYAPLKRWDLRLANHLYLQLTRPIPANAVVEVTNPEHTLWKRPVQFRTTAAPDRLGTAIHVNQTGYLPDSPKIAMAGFFLGSLGELEIAPAGTNTSLTFQVVDLATREVAYAGVLKPRPDRGFERQSYQKVFQADFTNLRKPGEYRLFIPGLGASFPFLIDEGVAAAFARAYALGTYHQRCGQANALPFTRFLHGACHTAPAEVPNSIKRFEAVNDTLKKESANCKDNPRHSAPALSNINAGLYPFVNQGPIEVRGGHHDAGDYSKYTINSASFIHHLVFSADIFPGVAELDNLGIPESGDGKSDVLQIAKWEADFLAKMQDADGGFYFLVYPRDRRYEDNVTPDKGDPQVVFPKTTSVTAAAIAALAQCASSPRFKQEFPEAAALYLDKARKGWLFLEQAILRHGKDGSYQKISHYGDEFMHDDEIIWAACELFLATQDNNFGQFLLDRFNPSDPNTRKWGWWRLYDAWGCAIRSYAFAERSGRVKQGQLNRAVLRDCEAEIEAAGADQLKRANESAYGTSFPDESKRARSAGWYFFADPAFDLAVACQLEYPKRNDPRQAMRAAIIGNLNYEQGCNPVNVAFLTGMGWKRQREIVHQFAQNDRRVLPPSGIPLGNVQGGISWVHVYGGEPAALSFPSDGSRTDFYPFYDRWSDAFNLSQEFVILHQARGLACLAWLMAETPLRNQPWKSAPASVVVVRGDAGATEFRLEAPGIDLSKARIVWEAEGLDPRQGASLALPANSKQPGWVEAEAQLPDGRRVFAIWEPALSKE